MENIYWITELSHTPIGPIGVAASRVGLVRISLYGLAGLLSPAEDKRRAYAAPTFPKSEDFARSPDSGGAPHLLKDAVKQLAEYFERRRKVFELPIDLAGVPAAHRAILDLVKAIPFGEMRTYGQLARQIGKPGAAILVGSANAANPLPLVIPCHRVVGSDHRLHGFAAPGGLATKAWLLEMEGNNTFSNRW